VKQEWVDIRVGDGVRVDPIRDRESKMSSKGKSKDSKDKSDVNNVKSSNEVRSRSSKKGVSEVSNVYGQKQAASFIKSRNKKSRSSTKSPSKGFINFLYISN
jgi:hypothetical protein